VRYRVHGLGFKGIRFIDEGLRFEGVRLRVLDLGFMVWGLWFGMRDEGLRV
jgi:hypothetical protein